MILKYLETFLPNCSGVGWGDFQIEFLSFANTKFDVCLFQTINSIFLNVYIEGKMFWLDLVLYDFFIMLVWGRCRIFYSLGLFCTHSFDSILTTSLFFCPANGLRMPFNPTSSVSKQLRLQSFVRNPEVRVLLFRPRS